VYNLTKRPRLVYIREPCDLIHTTSGVLPLNRKPFVVGVEYYSSFVGLQHDKALQRGYFENTLKRLLADNCKSILPTSEASKKSMIATFGQAAISKGLVDKMEVVYPAVVPRNAPRKRKTDTIRVLHIGSGFFEKGGRELVRAVEILKEDRKLDVELVLVTSSRPFYDAEFSRFLDAYRDRDWIKVVPTNQPREVLYNDYYGQSDIFALPSYGDFFGYVFLEAMACGLPLVGTDVFAIPEIIQDGINGFVVKTPIGPFRPDYLRKSDEEIVNYLQQVIHQETTDLTRNLVDRIGTLVEDRQLRKKMGEESRRIVTEGRFSVAHQNAQLKRIYDEALSIRPGRDE
jgi:glycosyltransferase involved in cell wall biosynthesis